MTLEQRLLACLSINDPLLGKVAPDQARAGFLWPNHHWQMELLAVTEGQGRRLEEYFFRPATAERSLPAGITQLPVAVMFDGAHARVYSAHALVPQRAPLLVTDASLRTTADDGFLGSYFESLHGGDMEGALRQFADDGYIQHSDGARHVAPDALRQDFINMFDNNRGRISVRFANVTDDGRIRAFECLMPNGRPAVAVYQRSPQRKIAGLRIYL